MRTYLSNNEYDLKDQIDKILNFSLNLYIHQKFKNHMHR